MLGNIANKNCVIKFFYGVKKTSNGFGTSNLDIAENLNNYFRNIGHTLNNDFQSNDNDFS